MMTVERVSPALGAEVTGLRLVDADDDAVEALYAALIAHQVLFLPDQHLAPIEHAAFARRCGELGARHHSYVTHPDSDDVVVLDWQPGQRPDASEWHSDMSFTAEPPFASILQAVQVPPVGGDTLWASMYAVHDCLDPGFRRDLEALSATHDPGAFRNGPYVSGGTGAMNEMLSTVGSAVWPVISHHPVSGRPYVNVSESNTRWIIGLGAAESARILTMLFDIVNRPDHQVRLRWRPGMIAIWDNRATQHYAVSDYPNDRRIMHRVVVARDTRSAV
ncbi:TauD/TfdA dioxygenase family protein [Ilumatobacter sp.]|uniref:TauD/TfdA dioxygenase family protein n=1 Tax=Ilumatobacter sp. TaxID=1967498 RepID=UPI003C424F0A